MSIHQTLFPIEAKQFPVTKPTYPVPIIPILKAIKKMKIFKLGTNIIIVLEIIVDLVPNKKKYSN